MLKNIQIWLGSYIQQQCAAICHREKEYFPTHIMLCVVDHFEPNWHGADSALQKDRIRRWVNEYPKLVEKHIDSDGYHPRHTFFYPAEMYRAENLEMLHSLCKAGFGEVEIHLHHQNDTYRTLKEKLVRAIAQFSQHGFLGKNAETGKTAFGFIHGNWALNNSRHDGAWCGVNNETVLLQEIGCYADFTLPSAPSETQTKIINSVYYPSGNPDRPKSHNSGDYVTVGQREHNRLMIIQGPLTLNWQNRKCGILPRIENGEITKENLPSRARINMWVNQHISVRGRPEWIFVKVHTHGAKKSNADVLLGDPMGGMFSYLETSYRDQHSMFLHYVSAREMFNIIKAAEAGKTGNPNDFRNFCIEKPSF